MSNKLPIFKIAGDKTVPTLKLDREVCVVGRAGGANLTLNAPQVSKLHAMVIQDTHGVYVRDLASKNGVEVNGSIIREATLRNDDVVRIGSYTLKCETGFTQDANEVLEAPAAELRTDEQAFPFPEGRHTMLIGSRDGCDVKLNDASVAPVHAVIFEVEGKRFVHSFAPTSTTINGSSAHGEELHPGDELRVGDVSLHYAPAETEAHAETPSDAAFIDEIELEPHAEHELDVVDMAQDAASVEVEDEQAVEVEEVAAGEDVSDLAPAEPEAASEEIEVGELEVGEVEAGPMDTADVIEPVHVMDALDAAEAAPPSLEPLAIDLAPEPQAPPVKAAAAAPAEPIAVEPPVAPRIESPVEPPVARPVSRPVAPPAEPVAAAASAANADEIDLTPFDLPAEQPGKPQWLIDAEREELNATIDWTDSEPATATPLEPALPELDPAELSGHFGEDNGAIEALAPMTQEEITRPPVRISKPIEDPEVAPELEPAEPPEAPAAEVIVEDDSEEEIGLAPEVHDEAPPEAAHEEHEEPMKARPVAAAESTPESEPASSPAPAEMSVEEISALVDELSAKIETLKSAWAKHRARHGEK